MKKAIFFLFALLLIASIASAWQSGWTYRKSHNITSAAGADVNYNVKIIVHYGAGTDSNDEVYLNSHSNANFSDVRFADTDDNLLGYWMEDYELSDNATFWVKITGNLTADNQTIYLYYSNTAVNYTGNMSTTFLNYIDGETGDLDINLAGNADYDYGQDCWKKYGPVLALGAPGSWESSSAGLDPAFMYENDSYIVIYGGTDALNDIRIGLATGNSLSNLTKSGSNPVLDIGAWSKWDDEQIYPGTLMRVDLDYAYYMWYGGTDGTNMRMGLAVSDDLITWTKPNLGLYSYGGNTNNNIVMDLGAPGTWDDATVGGADVKKVGSTYYMFYTGYDGSILQIGKATSTDGKNWVKYAGNPVITVGPAGTWNDLRSWAGNFDIINNIWYMWYAGYYSGVADSVDTGKAYSTDEGNTWYEYKGNPTIFRGQVTDNTRIESFYARYLNNKLQALYEGSPGTGYRAHYTVWKKPALGIYAGLAASDGWALGSMQTSNFKASAMNEISQPGITGSIWALALIDSATTVVPEAWATFSPKDRFGILRHRREVDGKFEIYYINAAGVRNYWNGAAWDVGLITYGGPGWYQLEVWDDGTNFKADIKDADGVSILTNVASIPKASVKAFSSGVNLISAEPLTSHHYVPALFTNYYVRNFVDPEPGHGAWGSEETEPAPTPTPETPTTTTAGPPLPGISKSKSEAKSHAGQNIISKETLSWSNIASGIEYTGQISSESIGISKISITAKGVTDANIVISRLASKPTDIVAPSNNVYGYFEITSSINDANLDSSIITFNVDNSWLTSNNIDPQTITFNRFYNGEWTALDTVLIETGDTVTQYEATTKGFSYFAITGEQVKTKESAVIDVNQKGIAGICIVVFLVFILIFLKIRR